MKKINIILFSMFLFSISSQYTVAEDTVAKDTVAAEVMDKASWTNYIIDSFPSILGNNPRNIKRSFLNDLNTKKLNILDNSSNDKINTPDRLKKTIALTGEEAEDLSELTNAEHTYNEKTFFERWTTASAYTWTQIGMLSTLGAVAAYKVYSFFFADKAAEDDDQL